VKVGLLALLRCPETGAPLRLRNAAVAHGEVERGDLVTSDGSRTYPIIDFIPRFVPPENYAHSFGLQWRRFRRTQLDSHTGAGVSRARFFSHTGWTPEELAGKWVLDAGCGAGRFTEIALACGARVVAVDASRAADACWQNHRYHPNLDVLQADIAALPFEPA
jgi:uncharacterized protein YbaR (Trm112 family)